MLGAHVVGPAGRVERVADEHEAGSGQAFGNGHAAHTPSHGAPSEEDPLRFQGVPAASDAASFTTEGDQDRRAVGSSPAGQACRGSPFA